jgi:hypothetical protein
MILSITEGNPLPSPLMKNLTKKIFSRKVIILILAIALCGINIFYLTVFVMSKVHDPAAVNLEPGSQFADFRKALQGVGRAGYLTNKNTGRTNNDGIYLQAQNYLAPTVLTLNEPGDLYNILDLSHSSIAIYKIKELNAKLVTENLYGQALVKRKEP